MMAVLGMLRIVPSWCYWIRALVVLCLGCDIHGAGRVQAKWDARAKQQTAAAEAALELRREQNRAIGAEQALKSAQIQKGHDDEMAKVRADLRNSERLRLGTAWCDGSTPDLPKPVAPPAAMQPVPPAGYFLQSWTQLLTTGERENWQNVIAAMPAADHE